MKAEKLKEALDLIDDYMEEELGGEPSFCDADSYFNLRYCRETIQRTIEREENGGDSG